MFGEDAYRQSFCEYFALRHAPYLIPCPFPGQDHLCQLLHQLDQYLPVPDHSQGPLGQGDPAEGLPGGQRGEEHAGDSEELVDGQRRSHQ